MNRHFAAALLTGASACLITACGGATAGSPASKVADAPIETLDAAAVKQLETDAMQAGSELNAPYNAFLAKYVVAKDGINLVAYGKVTDADKAALKGYIDALVATDMSAMTDAQAQAHWYNLYNAKTVDLILDNYPLDSIRDIKKPWDQKLLTVGGRAMSLNDIEHETLRKDYDEPRVHFAVNCASIGCPNLMTRAWEADTLDADLDAAARDYVSHPRGVSLDDDGDVDLSKIFKWYGDDFGPNEKAVMTYLAQFADGPKKTALMNAKKVDDYDYDWSLNIAE